MKKGLFLLLLLPLTTLVGCATKCYEPIGACSLIPDPGPCEALIPKYYYDQDTEECREFHWGGCEGTVPFDTMEECLECIEK